MNKETENDISGGGKTILVVEDEESVRNVTIRILQGLGFQVLSASNGRQAIDIFTREQKNIDLAIIDVIMPGINGPETYKQIVPLKPGLPVIFVTGYEVNAELAGLNAESGSIAFLQKPFTKATLSEKLSALLK